MSNFAVLDKEREREEDFGQYFQFFDEKLANLYIDIG